jgi:hypothetical protein
MNYNKLSFVSLSKLNDLSSFGYHFRMKCIINTGPFLKLPELD